jgi:hypothetical protein
MVFTYLDFIIENYKDVNPPIDEPTKGDLVKIRHQIELLSLPAEKGTEYDAGPKKTPKQHIRRQCYPKWATKKSHEWKELKQSKFTILADGDQTWSFNHSARQYWNQYDLLGLFFSKMGPAPGGGSVADQRNFYLPLTAVYGKFCLWIGGNQKPKMMDNGNPQQDQAAKGTGIPPACFQCTWRPDTGAFFLGATLAGFDANGAGTWEDELRGTRYHLLDGFFDFPGTWGTFEEGRSPTRTWDVDGKTLFGNCGETYPYLEMMGPNVSTIEERANTRGLALASTIANVREYQADAYRGMLIPPCLNCQQLLRYAGIYNVDRFAEDSTKVTHVFPPQVPIPLSWK